jgi:hypothetical protein
MAFTLNAAVKVIFNCRDESGNEGKVTLHAPSSQLASVVQTNATALAALIQAITGCSVHSYSYSYEVEDPAAAAPAVGSRIEHKGRFIFELANGLETRMEVPGILQSIVLGDGAIDLANSDVDAFVVAVQAGTAYSGVTGSDIGALTAAYEAFRRSTKNMLPRRRLAS